MIELQIFNNEEFGQLRTVEIDGKTWFIGRDLASSLKYQNGSRDINRHVDEDDRQTVSVFDGKQKREVIVVNESGMYALIMGSTLPSARRFKHWVTSEVLPSIRKNGGYLVNQENMTPEQIVANALIVAQNIIAERDRQIEEMTPKAEYFDRLVDRNLLTNFRDTAKELGIGQNKFITFLLETKYVYRDQNGTLKPYSTYTGKDKLFEMREYAAHNSDHSGLQTLITPKGRETFRLLLEKEI